MMREWRLLDRASPSGKQLFECSSCGRVSPTPDKFCGIPACESYSAEREAEAMRKLDKLSTKFRGLLKDTQRGG